MELRLGTILVDKGILTDDQVKAVLNVQQRTGRPFGLICEQMYDIAPKTIEAACFAKLHANEALAVAPFTQGLVVGAYPCRSFARGQHGDVTRVPTPRRRARALAAQFIARAPPAARRRARARCRAPGRRRRST